MDVTLALLCDSANVTDDGKLNVLGQFDTISAIAFPTLNPMMHLVLRFSATPAEAGQDRTLTIRLVNADGNTIGEVSGPLEVPNADGSGRLLTLQLIIPFPGMTFPEPGSYAFHILIDQDDKRSVPIEIESVVTTRDGGDEDAG